MNREQAELAELQKKLISRLDISRELKDEESGDSVHLYSDRDTWVVYSMGGIPEDIYPARDKGKMAKEFEALALEAQFLPDAINNDGFGDIVLPANTEKTYTIAFEYHKG